MEKIVKWNTKAETTAREALSVSKIEVLNETFNNSVQIGEKRGQSGGQSVRMFGSSENDRLGVYKRILQQRNEMKKQHEKSEMSFHGSELETSTRKDENVAGSSSAKSAGLNQIEALKERLAQRTKNAEKKVPNFQPDIPKVLIPSGANYDDQAINPIHRIYPVQKSTRSNKSSDSSDSGSVKNGGFDGNKKQQLQMVQKMYNRSKAHRDQESLGSSTKSETIPW